MNLWNHAGQVRRLQDEERRKPSQVPEYAVTTLATSTSVETMMNLQQLLFSFPKKGPETRRKAEPVEDTDAYVIYAQQMAYRGKEVWNDRREND